MSFASERPFNVPRSVVVLSVIMALLHLGRGLLDETQDLTILLYLAFLPARYTPDVLLDGTLPGGVGADIWTFVTYQFLHVDLLHLGVNLFWMLAFGSAVAWRFGSMKFTLFFMVCGIMGAVTHLVCHAGEAVPLIGASAAISGCMSAASRFIFVPNGPLGREAVFGQPDYRVPAMPLGQLMRDTRVLSFLGVWFGMNLLFGLGGFFGQSEGYQIAWEAHIGGFLAGFALFGLFDQGSVDQSMYG